MAPPTPKLSVSLSAIQAFRRCEQLYAYKYVERLRPRTPGVALELGSVIHEYLALYYQGLKDGAQAEIAHEDAQLEVAAKYLPQMRRNARAAKAAGKDDIARMFIAMTEMVARITEAYFHTRGYSDAQLYEILLVENWVTLDIVKGITSNGRVDLVTREKEGYKRVALWEHKSTTSVPDVIYRLRDIQTALYNEKLTEMDIAPPIDMIVWNYIRTKEPSRPRLLKAGGLSKDKGQDTTWEVYRQEIAANGLDEADYADMRQLFEGREYSVFFPRFEQPLVSEAETLMRDYTRTARDIRQRREAWAEGSRVPVRNLSRDCSYCEMSSLCNAVIFSGDDSDIRRLRFIQAT